MRTLTVFINALLVVAAVLAGTMLFVLGFEAGADFTKRQAYAKKYGEK